jgi:hypothetical protein
MGMKIATIAFAVTLLGVSPAAFATQKGGAPKPQTHHCQLNGAEVQKSKKACLKAGGTWVQGAPSGQAPAPAAAPAAGK